MAVQAPEARELKSWEDAFQYPLPVIRKLEQQLRAGVDDNREKVRSLVGSGYRDLLGTADRIIEMNAEVHHLEDLISDMGQKCSSRLVSRVASQHEKLALHRTHDLAAQRRPAAEVALVQACLIACRRLLSGNGDLLLAARLLLLARLLQNSAAKSPEGIKLLKTQRLKLSSIRTRLLSMIEDRLIDTGLSRGQTLDILLAHSVVNTSSLADALRYLLRVRQQCIEDLCAKPKRKATLKAIDLLVATLEQANSLFPRRLSEAMERLTGPHLLQDEPLRAILDFDLALYERWISNDIKSFVPWLRTSDLTKATLEFSLKGWASTASSTITSGLQSLVTTLKAPLRVSSLREKILRHLLSHVSTQDFDKDALIVSLRSLFNSQLSSLTKTRAESLSSHVTSILSSEIDKNHSLPSLWDQDTAKLSLRSGGANFRDTVLHRTLGKDASLVQLDNVVAQWTSSLDELRRVGKDMRQLRWADELDLEDESEGTKWQTLLAEQDPQELTEDLDKASTAAVEASVGAIAAAAAEQGTRSTALFLLRVLKALPLPEAFEDKATHIRKGLHARLANAVVEGVSAEVQETVFASTPAVALWHGLATQTPLPVMPSPGTVRLPSEVCGLMDQVGVDVWSSEAVEVVRADSTALVEKSLEQWIERCEAEAVASVKSNGYGPVVEDQAAGTEDDAENDGDKPAPESSSEEAPTPTPDPGQAATETDGAPATAQRYTQALFDSIYLRELLCPRDTAHKLGPAIDKLKQGSNISEDDYDRVIKNAQAYHRRSYLLFGMLMC